MKRDYIKYIMALLLFGSNGLVASFIGLNSSEIVLLRTLLGSITLAAIFFASRRRPAFFGNKKAFLFLCLSGICMGASWLFLYEGYARLGVSIASLCNYCGPVIVMALSPVIFREKLTPIKILGFAAVVCGVFLINGKAAGSGDTIGLICGIMSALTYAFMIIFNKLSADIEGLENSMFQLISALVTVALFVTLTQGFALPVTAADLPAILMLGIINTGVGCYLYFSAIGKLPVQSTAILGYLEPLSAVFFSVVFLREILLPAQIVGGILIIGGAASAELLSRRKQTS